MWPHDFLVYDTSQITTVPKKYANKRFHYLWDLHILSWELSLSIMKNINRKNQSNYLTINIVVLFCCYFSLSMSQVSICFSLIIIYKGAIVTYQDPMRTARLLRPLCRWRNQGRYSEFKHFYPKRSAQWFARVFSHSVSLD